MKKLLAISLVALCGCVTSIKPEHKAKIALYEKQGKIKQAEKELERTVGMGASLWWSLIPGANQIHMARKIKQSPYAAYVERDYPGMTTALNLDGWICATVSVIPYVWDFTMPFQMACTPTSVIRINNLVYMYHIDSMGYPARAKKR